MNYSLTYASLIALVLVSLFQKAGIQVAQDDIQTTVVTVIQAISAIGILIGRYRAGGVNILGVKK